jgi:hypothetical protein
MLDVATSAFPSPGRSQRPSWRIGWTVSVSAGSPNMTMDGLTLPTDRWRIADAKRHGSAAVVPGTRSASATTVAERTGSLSWTWTS